MAQPTISYQSLDAAGVHLLPSTSPEFAAALDPSRPTAGDALLPYAVLLKNDSDRNIMAFSVRWTCLRPEGPPVTSDETDWNFSTLKPEDGIPAHRARLFSEISWLGTRHAPKDESTRQRADDRAALYRTMTSVVVSVEAVLFDDGTVAGPSHNGWGPRLIAMLDADRDLADEVLRTPSAGEVRKNMAGLRDSAYLHLASGEPKDAFALARAANRATSYDECYTMIKAHHAARLLDSMDRVGDTIALQRLKDWRSQRKYPGE